MFYSNTTKGFYTTDIHGENIPSDAVEITNEYHSELINQQGFDKFIDGDENGYPILKDVPAPSAEQLLNSMRLSRQLAYQEEADPLFFKYQRGEATIDEWKHKIQEIKFRYPY